MDTFLSPRPALTPWLDSIILGMIGLGSFVYSLCGYFPGGAQASEGVPKRTLMGEGWTGSLGLVDANYYI